MITNDTAIVKYTQIPAFGRPRKIGRSRKSSRKCSNYGTFRGVLAVHNQMNPYWKERIFKLKIEDF